MFKVIKLRKVFSTILIAILLFLLCYNLSAETLILEEITVSVCKKHIEIDDDGTRLYILETLGNNNIFYDINNEELYNYYSKDDKFRLLCASDKELYTLDEMQLDVVKVMTITEVWDEFFSEVGKDLTKDLKPVATYVLIIGAIIVIIYTCYHLYCKYHKKE